MVEDRERALTSAVNEVLELYGRGPVEAIRVSLGGALSSRGIRARDEEVLTLAEGIADGSVGRLTVESVTQDRR
jgi:hypothetical protein